MIIDRIEGQFAVIEIEKGRMINLPLVILPQKVKEGDVLKIIIDKAKTRNRQAEMYKIVEELWN